VADKAELRLLVSHAVRASTRQILPSSKSLNPNDENWKSFLILNFFHIFYILARRRRGLQSQLRVHNPHVYW
jgi:hypothetical protein